MFVSAAKRFSVRILGAVAFLIFSLSHNVYAFDAADTFDKSCSSCHTIGQGDDIGPDLKGVTKRRKEAWIISFIQSSQTLIKAGDTAAVAVFNKYRKKKMPDQELTADQIKTLLKFIETGEATGKAPQAKKATKATTKEIALGRELFLGQKAFAADGPSCVSCHSVRDYGPLGGGTLAPDLSQAYSAYEDQGMTSVLSDISFAIMREVYKDKKLTEDEVFAVKSFLYKVDQEPAAIGGHQKKFLFLGMGGGAVMMGLIDLIWRQRRKKSAKPRRGGTA